jgi:hypothetical protein
MEEARRRRQPALKVERAFAGSRLEQQILMRVDELAAPILRNRTAAVLLSEPSDRLSSNSIQFQPVARGA